MNTGFIELSLASACSIVQNTAGTRRTRRGKSGDFVRGLFTLGKMPWSDAFDDPVPHPDGGTIRTLEQAGRYILALPKRDAESDHSQLAMAQLIEAAEDRGPLLHARVGMMRALNHGKSVPQVVPRGKPAKSYRIIR